MHASTSGPQLSNPEGRAHDLGLLDGFDDPPCGLVLQARLAHPRAKPAS